MIRYISLLLFIGFAFGQYKMEIYNLIDSNGQKYAPNDDEPYTGKSFSFYGNSIGDYGQVEIERTYKDGKEDGLETSWYKNGQKRKEGIRKDGLRDGKQTGWYENGQKMYEGTYKDGKIDGLNTVWYENGQKRSEVSFKDGKEDGKWTNWFENGQKKEEGTYKDGKKMGIWEYWDRDGNVDKIIDIATEVKAAAEKAEAARLATAKKAEAVRLAATNKAVAAKKAAAAKKAKAKRVAAENAAIKRTLDALKIESVLQLGEQVLVIINGQNFTAGETVNNILIESITVEKITFRVGDKRIIKDVGRQ